MQPPQGVDFIDTGPTINWLHDGILFVAIKETTEHTLADAKRNVSETIQQFGENGIGPHLIDISNIDSMSRDARKYYAEDASEKYTTATALITKNPVARIIGNFFIGLNKSKTPTKLFTSEEEAIEWLKTFK